MEGEVNVKKGRGKTIGREGRGREREK